MKVYVYIRNSLADLTICYLDEPSRIPDTGQIIEAEETDLPITTNWKGVGIAIGEVFHCNDSLSKVIRTK